ncbi:MAG: methylmalonyl-CoA mutase family protein [Edaphobacter sp.]|uniref:acyl-CoA mutase large subunit family protein n=1 Tax=Edaphobacter sp. TaxID=1934404 RepID=UPI00239F1650|nr:methylmalonyl-CoA mutase family protein [Edaphobacter sp.]MDE1175940.1 methylmalonyl-CoA mutase family protein [Edaphobacter sp.]
MAKMPEPLKTKPVKTSSGIAVDRVYGPESLTGFDPHEALGEPGEYPFTRGTQATMYRGRLWTMRQYAGMGDAEESNRRYKFLLSQGTKGLSIAFDLPTQIGYDSDSPYALGEVGRVGVAIDSIEDMERLLDGIRLDTISTSMTINATAPILLALYVAVARRQGADLHRLAGTVQNDILKEYIARGTYIFPVQHAMRLVTDVLAWTAVEVPEWHAISISGYHMREAGCTAVQEIAFTLANGMTYVQAAIDAGLAVDTFAPRLSFFFNAHNNLLEEVAKFRAARRMWASIMREHFGAKNPKSWMLRFHTQTAGSTLTAQQPENNIVRTTVQALAAVLGGTQSLHTNGFDEALALPSEAAARIALRTQQVLAFESGVTDTVDPLAGSYYVESLTNEIESRAEEYLTNIARFDLGGKYGMLRAIEQGYVQREIQTAAYAFQRAVDEKTTIVVGVNDFVGAESSPVPLERRDETLEQRQVERLKELRVRRDAAAHAAALRAVIEGARSSENLMPRIQAAVEAYATVGEIADALRSVFGEYRESVVV